MKPFFQTYRNTILIVGAVVIFGVGYYYLGSSDLFGFSERRAAAADAPLSNQILASIMSLNGVTLDGSIFSDPVFQSLSNTSIAIAPQRIGRVNPFLPVTNASSVVTSPSTTNTGTTKTK